MKNIKGPKSALSDFIKESNIKINNRPASSDFIAKAPIESKRKSKRIKYAKPFELVNADTIKSEQEDCAIEQILENIDTVEVDDELLDKIAQYLSRKRKMNKIYFDFIHERATNKMTVYDCSMIRDWEIIISKRLTVLELYQCGQLTENTLNCILNQMSNLEVLRVTGAFLLEDFNVPSTLKTLDVSHCSRLKDTFIDNMNIRLKRLYELKLSFCYGLTKDARLTVDVERLFVCETRLSNEFYACLSNIKWLSVRLCPNINSVPSLKLIEYLDVEGIVTLQKLEQSKTLKHLNIAMCSNISELNFPNLISLNVSSLNLTEKCLNQILKLKKLKELDVSWNNIVNDVVIDKIMANLMLERLFVFGCFELSKESVKSAYNNKICKVIGNPTETRYLLEEI